LKRIQILPLLIENIESRLEENISVQIEMVDEKLKELQHELITIANTKSLGDELGMEIKGCVIRNRPFRPRQRPVMT